MELRKVFSDRFFCGSPDDERHRSPKSRVFSPTLRRRWPSSRPTPHFPMTGASAFPTAQSWARAARPCSLRWNVRAFSCEPLRGLSAKDIRHLGIGLVQEPLLQRAELALLLAHGRGGVAQHRA